MRQRAAIKFLKRRFSSSTAAPKLWGGRFTGDVDPDMNRFNRSLPFDRRFWKVDIRASQKYAQALEKVQLLTVEETDLIVTGLEQVFQEWESGTFIEKEEDEDIHAANERRLGELIGIAAKKLHTGRSRNDQCAVDLRLWCRDEFIMITELLNELLAAFVDHAEKEIDVLMPGFTHLQRAQPVRFSHWLLSHAWPLKRDIERLHELMERHNRMPLGSGALAGNPFGINRDDLAKELGFSGPTPNSMDGTMERDIVAEFMQWASLTGVHLSRWAEDMIIYNSREFNFITLADAYSTGSSLMPQKKNPDSLELIRGKSGRVFGNMSGFMMTLKGLPSCYNKDMQEDKEPLFDTVDTIGAMLRISCGVVSTMTVNKNKCEGALDVEMLATDIAYYLVRKGIPFRIAHELSGVCVLKAEEANCSMSELPFEVLKSVSEHFEPDVEELWNYENSVEQYSVVGGTAKSSVQQQISELRSFIK